MQEIVTLSLHANALAPLEHHQQQRLVSQALILKVIMPLCQKRSGYVRLSSAVVQMRAFLKGKAAADLKMVTLQPSGSVTADHYERKSGCRLPGRFTADYSKL